MVECYKVTVKGKEYKIPKADIENYVKNLQCSIKEGIETWLYDRDILECAEEKALTEKAKALKLPNAKADKERKTSKPKPKIASDEKKEIFEILKSALQNYNTTVEKENKLLIVNLNDKILKIDLIEQRPKK